MFLKSIEVRGFKSFADKTELDFKKGITAVIGPNGSGKSNISDAVRWVLGEQSVKSLRGAKMQDVIFAGTQFRKPVGVAQVSLVLDNQDKSLQIDYSQVKVTRRIYRSGESEYLINNTKCRLKDIQELFMDTGIGKEGYSLIGQGKIEAILSGHTEDRRLLFEEAAGIVKFKTRKKEAERRLKNTDENLIRINDLISTYEERIEPLRTDKEKAEQFIEYSEGLKEREVNVLLHGYEKNLNLDKDNDVALKEAVVEIEDSNQKLTKKTEKMNSLEESFEIFEKEISIQRQKFYSEKNLKEKMNGEINLLNERLSNAEQLIKNNENELESLTKKQGKIKVDKSESEDDLAGLQVENDINSKMKSEMEVRSNEISGNLSVLESKIGKTNQEIEKVKEELLHKKSNYQMIEKEFADLKEKKEEVAQNIQNVDMAGKIKQKTIEELINKKQNIECKVETLKEEIIENKKKIIEKKRAKQLAENQNNAFRRELNMVDARKNALDQLNEKFEGYNKSVQRLMNEVHKIIPEYKEKCWVLGELIDVEKKYELAIEIALGSAISNVITENQIIAKKLIYMLKEKRMGRATFLPIDIVKGRKLNINDGIRRMNGFIGVADQLVKYNPKYANAIQFTLGRTVIVDNMDNALKIGKSAGLSFRIVTLDGQVVNPGGSLTGGSIYNKNNSIIGRKREVEELTIKGKEILDKMKRFSSDIEFVEAEIEKIDENILNAKDQIHEEEIENAKVNARINSINDEKDFLLKEKESSQKVLSKILNDVMIVKDEIEGFEDKNIGMRRILDITTKNVEEYTKSREELTRENSDLIKKITDRRILEAEIIQKITNKSSDINRINNEIKVVAEKISEIQNNIERSKIDRTHCLEKIQENSESSKRISEYLIKAEKDFDINEKKKIEIKEAIKILSSEIKEGEEQLQILNKNITKFEVIKAKIESERDNILERLNDDLNLTIAEAEGLKNDEIDISLAAKEIKIIKDKIGALGVVNLGAIEEYKEVSEKYNFMSSQREDLILSKEELIKLIEEMTGKMRVLFKENFEIMRRNFNVTFKELFKGGSADLIIGEGDELKANIEINVQPPGKKLQSITLMSGGEKVLSAIALLFAILKMKPTPFCILDEIEAALDDANVFRFAEFIKKFSGNIQFIVITHRKGTMSMSDMVYGVTMEEKGVSKVLSLELNNQTALL